MSRHGQEEVGLVERDREERKQEPKSDARPTLTRTTPRSSTSTKEISLGHKASIQGPCNGERVKVAALDAAKAGSVVEGAGQTSQGPNVLETKKCTVQEIVATRTRRMQSSWIRRAAPPWCATRLASKSRSTPPRLILTYIEMQIATLKILR